MNNYTSNQLLSMDQLRRFVPSVFTQTASDRTSAKYTHISTQAIVEGLIKENFLPVHATQSRSRTQDKRLHTKHMIRFRQGGQQVAVGGLFPEIILINSHDGLSSYKLMAGLYRLICSNGMVAGDTYKEVRVRHQGDILGNVIEGSYEVIKESQKMLEASTEMNEIVLNPEEKKIFAEAVHEIYFDGDEKGQAFEPGKLLRPRRYQEANKNDLFTTFNIAQENVIKGGVSGWARDERGNARRTTMREVKAIDRNTSLNRALWSLAEKMAELKR